MKVCLIVNALPPFYSGAEWRAYRFAEQLNDQPGVEALLIGLYRLPTQRMPLQPYPRYVHAIRLCTANKEKVQVPPRLFSLPIYLAEIALRVGALLFKLRHRYDMVHIYNPASWFSLVPIPIARILGKPVIVEMTLRGSDDPLKLSRRSGSSQRQVFPHRPLKYTLFLMAQAYVSKSDGLTQVYLQAGLPAEKLVQIPSGVDVERFKPANESEKQALREKLGLPVHATIILFLGGMEARKGAHRLLEAYREVAAQHPRAHLALVGPAERFEAGYRQKLEEDIHQWKLEHRLTFRPQLVEHPEEYLRAADIFALPTSREGFSMAILEAMACGLPVVASDIPEIAGCQVNDGVHGLLVPYEDSSALGEALSRLLIDSHLRKRLGEAGRARVLQEFSQENIIERYLALYKQILNEYRL